MEAMALNTKGFEQFLKLTEAEQNQAVDRLAAKNNKALDQGAKLSQAQYEYEQKMRGREDGDLQQAIAMSEAMAKIDRAKQGEEEYQL